MNKDEVTARDRRAADQNFFFSAFLPLPETFKLKLEMISFCKSNNYCCCKSLGLE